MKQKPDMIHFEKKDHTAIINIPSFDTTSIKTDIFAYDFAELCATIEADDDVRVVIITDSESQSPSKNKRAKKFPSSDQSGTESPLLPSTSASIANIDRPTLAVINGNAAGEGLELALACDIRIASESSFFGLPHIREGHIPHNGGTQRMPRLIGKGRALEMILTGASIDAREALRIGLVNMVQPPGEAMKKALQLALDMATKAPISLRFTREAIYKGMDITLDQGLTMEGDLYLLLYGTEDRVEGIESFTKKKEPSFKGK